MLEKAEAEGRTDDGWTLVQCKCKPHKMGLDPDADGNHDHVNNNRDSNRFTNMNRIAKWKDATVITLKESVHERESNGDCKVKRERTTITSKLSG